MKKFILFSILIACFSSSYAQEKSFRFGFYGGHNQSFKGFTYPDAFKALKASLPNEPYVLLYN